jgi:hypothetical protein
MRGAAKASSARPARQLVARDRLVEAKPSAERARDRLVRSLAASLDDFGVPAPANGDFSQLITAMGDCLSHLNDARQTAESELSQATADRAALKALVSTQREELQSLRQQIAAFSEALRQQR